MTKDEIVTALTVQIAKEREKLVGFNTGENQENLPKIYLIGERIRNLEDVIGKVMVYFVEE